MATTFDAGLMSADRYAQMNGAYEPQRTNNASLRIFLGDKGISEDDVVLALRTFPLPKQSNGIIETDWMNEKRKFAGKVVIDDMELGFEDYCDKDTAKLLWAWRLKVYNPLTGHVGLAKDYKARGEITLMAPNGTLQRLWKLQGCWPSNMDPGDIDMAGEEAVRINLSMVVDKAYYGAEEIGGNQ